MQHVPFAKFFKEVEHLLWLSSKTVFIQAQQHVCGGACLSPRHTWAGVPLFWNPLLSLPSSSEKRSCSSANDQVNKGNPVPVPCLRVSKNKATEEFFLIIGTSQQTVALTRRPSVDSDDHRNRTIGGRTTPVARRGDAQHSTPTRKRQCWLEDSKGAFELRVG